MLWSNIPATEWLISVLTLHWSEQGALFPLSPLLLSLASTLVIFQAQFLVQFGPRGQHWVSDLCVPGFMWLAPPPRFTESYWFLEEHCHYPHFTDEIAAENLVNWPNIPQLVSGKARFKSPGIYSRIYSHNITSMLQNHNMCLDICGLIAILSM